MCDPSNTDRHTDIEGLTGYGYVSKHATFFSSGHKPFFRKLQGAFLALEANVAS